MQQSSLLSITEAYSTTSTHALHVLTGCPPLAGVRGWCLRSELMLWLRNTFNLLKIFVKLVAFRVLILRWPESHGRWSKLVGHYLMKDKPLETLYILIARKSRTEFGVRLFTSKKMTRFSQDYFDCLTRRQSLWLRLWQFGRLLSILLEDN
ncbi:hypothetical protein AVEN_200702-1 [Araneus ventricosus]|uniref:Uncharacterized protein n=1 Tax=Araneus ventricosus TaxID=182803 RepID=A0A4Y2DM30_ARAVE|nr:hypothetical protein AVEN_46689-1 [Araneus ventricosus]GBM16884.1 hypothetical protein AVEN_160650-1 [Araneus ventricosus]GBM16929.1 hypothetical protein AVEN_157630-1 [Araneus ventricosus]GBM16937.1 hypothetical protein AVEN_200702-1 [Araneus ventricosus]